MKVLQNFILTRGNNTLYINQGENYPIGEELSQSDVEKIIGMPISELRDKKYSNIVLLKHEEDNVTYWFGTGFITYPTSTDYIGFSSNFYTYTGGVVSMLYSFVVMFDADGNYINGSFVVAEHA